LCPSDPFGSLGECSEDAETGEAGEGERFAGERPFAFEGEKWNEEAEGDAAEVDMVRIDVQVEFCYAKMNERTALYRRKQRVGVSRDKQGVMKVKETSERVLTDSDSI
jgi:hypothetical protein